MEDFLTVNGDNLDQLSPEQAVQFFPKLLCAEASSLGIPKNIISVPFEINVPDGGIDAEISRS